jgi:hypothetical protein
MRFAVWACVAALCIGGAADSAEVYRWVDSRGVTQYGSNPPPGVQATRVNVPATPAPPPSATVPSSAAGREAGPPGAPGVRPEAASAASPSASSKPITERLQRCAESRQQLDVVTRQGPVFRYDARGERVYLPDEARDAEIARLRGAVASLCAGLDSDGATRDRTRQMIYFVMCRRATDQLRFLEQASTRSGQQDLDDARQAVRNYCESSRFPAGTGTRGEYFSAF